MRVLLGVCGGIAAYKSAALVRALKQRGDEVRVIMTHGAQAFITPMTLQVISEQPVGTETFNLAYESEIGHIDLARWADVILIAPATANLIGALAGGLAPDLLTTVTLATRAPVVIAPAMNTQMLEHPLVQRNLATLAALPNYHVVPSDSGQLACREVGSGRLPDPPVLLDALDAALAPQALAGVRLLMSAGPTREHVDPARFISNPSTGKMGYAIAQAARQMGAHVTLVSGPVALVPPPGVEVVEVISAQDLNAAIMARADESDLIIKVAAVCDWRPEAPSAQKRGKSDMSGAWQMVRTPDTLAELGQRFGPGRERGPLIVGFAAESHDVESRARAKLARKNAHLLVANTIGGASSAFGADSSSVLVLDARPEHPATALGPLPKGQLATMLLHHIADALARHRAQRAEA